LSGTLFIIGTPLGNLGDLTSRIKDALSNCEVVLAEDTRVSVKLVHHLGLHTKLISSHEHNEEKRLGFVEDAAARGATIGLMSDAGMPLISDPGYPIVQRAISLGMNVVPIPGPAAFLLALVGSGLPCDRFVYDGFLPDKEGERRKRLESLKNEERTLVFYLSPHDQIKVLSDALAVLGDRQACIARELTKKFEEYIRLPLTRLLERVQAEKLRGECVLVIAGISAQEKVAQESEVIAALAKALDSGERLKDASVAIAKMYGWSNSDVYKLGLQHRENVAKPTDA
jgi:16S rRNA (cytidine1402-2'-O)-methyltransferase